MSDREELRSLVDDAMGASWTDGGEYMDAPDFITDAILASDWLAKHDAKVLTDYLAHRDAPRVEVVFTNQPVFDALIEKAKAGALEEAAADVESSKPVQDGAEYRQGMVAGIDRALFRIRARAAEYRNTTESEGN
jgi:hypothetical protein